MQEQQTPEEKVFYKKNPNILAYFSIENNKINFDFDETKTDVSDVILLLHNTVNEFLKTISKNIKEQKINQIKEQQNNEGK